MKLRTKKENSLGYALTVFGVICVAYGVPSTYMAISAVFWPSTDGVVISSEITTLRRGTAPFVEHILEIRYQFNIGNNKYSGNTYRYGENKPTVITESKEPLTIIQERYPEGKVLPVYYSPSNPSKSVLHNDLTFNSFGVVLVGIGIIVIGWIANYTVNHSMLYLKKKYPDAEEI